MKLKETEFKDFHDSRKGSEIVIGTPQTLQKWASVQPVADEKNYDPCQKTWKSSQKSTLANV